MDDHASEELQRILSNPENEIISDSLKERLGISKKQICFSISFGSTGVYECGLESFSLDPAGNKISRISLLVSSEVVSSLFKAKEFSVYSDDLTVDIESKFLETVDCFKFDSDTYVLELSLSVTEPEGLSND